MLFSRYITCRVMMVLSAVGALLSSCSDDAGVYNIGDPEQEGDSPAITLRLPDVGSAAAYGSSRSENFDTYRAVDETLEASWTNLYLVAIPDVVDVSHPLRILTLRNGATSENGYTDYTVTLFPDRYRFYVLGNIDSYLTPEGELSTNLQDRGISDENDLRGLILNFSTSKTIEAGNLPMACLAEEISAYDNGTKQNLSDNYVEVASGKGTTIYADMTFLCSKVRYTILFDRTEGGFSKFGDGDIAFTGEGTLRVASNVRVQSAVTSQGTPSSEVTEIPNINLEAVAYPTNINEWLASGTNTPPSLEVIENPERDKDATRLAWQGITYLPENLNGNDGKHTQLVFTGSGAALKEQYKIVLDNVNNDVNTGGGNRGLKHGKYYDVVAKLTEAGTVQLPTSMTVTDWTTENMAAELHGPYELVVQKTENVAVESGKWTVLGYGSDVSVNFISPLFLNTNGTPYQIDGKEVNFYTIEPVTLEELENEDEEYDYEPGWDNYLRITVNDAIPYAELKKINTEKGNIYSYFHLKAGVIQKKIGIDPLTVDPILELNPSSITINVKEYLSSGINSSNLKIRYTTNVDPSEAKITIYDEGGIISTSSTASLYIPKIDEIEGSGGEYTLQNGKGELSINFHGMIGGDPFWQKESNLRLKFALEIDGKILTKWLTIHVKPYSTNYTIYFKAVNNEWDDAHIYVYQCLEMPYGLQDDYKKWEGKTVGYPVGDETEAALEYVFSNNISFRGWYGFGGPSVNNPNLQGTTFSNGYVFPGGSTIAGSYAPTIENDDRYNFGVDLNELHFEDEGSWVCDICRGYPDNPDALIKNDKGEPRMWPGIAMTPVTLENGEKWWKYVLTGIATPGKTMIMFNNGHKDKNQGRYPGDHEVGIPLFDYPDNTGYFLYNEINGNNQGFVNTKPDVPQKTDIKYRIYWNTDFGPGLHLWGWDVIDDNGTGNNEGNEWNNSLNRGKTTGSNVVNGYYYYEFYNYSNSGTLNYLFSNPKCSEVENHEHNGKISDFTLIDNVYVSYIETHDVETNEIKPGKPDPVERFKGFRESDVINIMWYHEYGVNFVNYDVYYIHGWSDVKENLFKTSDNQYAWPGTFVDVGDNDLHNFSYKFDANCEWLKIIIHNNGDGGDTRAQFKITPTEVTWESGQVKGNSDMTFGKEGGSVRGITQSGRTFNVRLW